MDDAKSVLLAKPAPRHRLTDEERKLRAMTEKELTVAIRQIAKVCHWRHYHTYRSERSPAGFPDEVYVRPPHVVFAELKREQAEPTPEQIAWLDDLAASGQRVYLFKPRDLENGDIAKVLSDPVRFEHIPSRWVAP